MIIPQWYRLRTASVASKSPQGRIWKSSRELHGAMIFGIICNANAAECSPLKCTRVGDKAGFVSKQMKPFSMHSHLLSPEFTKKKLILMQAELR